MPAVLRKAIFAVPFGCLVALVTHFVRFGDEHEFGGAANEALVATAIGGSIAIAVAIVHVFLTAGTSTTTGSVAASRARRLIPAAGPLFMWAAALYYFIELLEGNGIELGRPTLLLGLFAAILAAALRWGVALLADVVADIVRDWLARLDRRPRPIWYRSLQAQPVHAQVTATTRRFGRAPPNGRRSL